MYSLVKPNDTRWSSLLACIERMLLLQRHIQYIVPLQQHKNNALWSTLKDIASFLTPFRAATDVVQSDSATLFDVYQVFNNISAHIQSMKTHDTLQLAYQQSAAIARHHWHKHIHISATVACALLSFCSVDGFSIKDRQAVKDFILSFGASYLHSYSFVDVQITVINLRSVLLVQLSQFMGKTGCFKECESEYNSLKRAARKMGWQAAVESVLAYRTRACPSGHCNPVYCCI